MTHHSEDHRSQAMNECIDNCTQCHAICLETINYCLGKGGAHAAPEHIALLATCADICATSADAMLRGASVHVTVVIPGFFASGLLDAGTFATRELEARTTGG